MSNYENKPLKMSMHVFLTYDTLKKYNGGQIYCIIVYSCSFSFLLFQHIIIALRVTTTLPCFSHDAKHFCHI